MGWLIISKLKAACLAIKTVTALLSMEDSRALYYSDVLSTKTNGAIYMWGNWECCAL
jgi:hypothetical protein